jgi:hypothetical protein
MAKWNYNEREQVGEYTVKSGLLDLCADIRVWIKGRKNPGLHFSTIDVGGKATSYKELVLQADDSWAAGLTRIEDGGMACIYHIYDMEVIAAWKREGENLVRVSSIETISVKDAIRRS